MMDDLSMIGLYVLVVAVVIITSLLLSNILTMSQKIKKIISYVNTIESNLQSERTTLNGMIGTLHQIFDQNQSSINNTIDHVAGTQYAGAASGLKSTLSKLSGNIKSSPLFVSSGGSHSPSSNSSVDKIVPETPPPTSHSHVSHDKQASTIYPNGGYGEFTKFST